MNQSSQSLKKSLSIAAIIIAASDVGSRILGFLRVQVLAYYAGTGSTMDVYSFSFILPDLINHLLAGSALSITFIPLFQQLKQNKSETEAWKFFSNIAVTGTILFIIFIAGSMLFTERIISLAGSNIHSPQDPEKFQLAIRLTRIIVPAQLFFFWGALLNGVQYSHNRFLLPSFTPLLYNLGIITFGILFFPSLGIEGFSWGVVVGAFLGNVLIQIPGALRCGMKFYWYINIKDSQLRTYVLLTIPFIIGLSMTFSNEFLFRFFGSYLPQGTGALASLDYSYKLMFILVGLFGHSLAAGFYPFLTKLMLENKIEEIQRLFMSIVTKIGAFIIPFSVCMIVLSPHIITILFQRGKFTAESTVLTSSTFAAYMPATFFCAVILVINRLFYAAKNTLLPMIVSTSAVILSLPLYWFLGKHFNAPGVAYASSISMTVQCCVMFVLWNLKHKNVLWKGLLKNLFIIGVASAVAYGICKTVVVLVVIPLSMSLLWRTICICVIAFVPAYGAALIILEFTKVQQIQSLVQIFIKRKK